MKKLSTKIIAAIIIIIIAAVGIGVGQKYLFGTAQKGAKTITVTIENQVDNKVLVKDKVYHTNAATLEDFLNENKTELKAEITTTKYGPFLMGLDGLKTTNMDKGPWWMYGFVSKDTNANFTVGNAPAINKVNLGKESTVTFVFTDKM
ncbi:MAG: hypothetical protein ACRC6T_09485 [Sarcina sp.]